jgi:putative transposase
MKKFAFPEDKNLSNISFKSVLDDVLRDGARKMLQEAIENEVFEYIQRAREQNDVNKLPAIRNGYLPTRNIATGIGLINIRQPRVRERREGQSFSTRLKS